MSCDWQGHLSLPYKQCPLVPGPFASSFRINYAKQKSSWDSFREEANKMKNGNAQIQRPSCCSQPTAFAASICSAHAAFDVKFSRPPCRVGNEDIMAAQGQRLFFWVLALSQMAKTKHAKHMSKLVPGRRATHVVS